MAEKSFREDLYYRLSSFVLRMPSLRERKEEIPMMLRHFMLRVAERYACPILPLSPRLLRACEDYSWPGNIRQLENFVKRYLVLGDEESAIRELEDETNNPDSAKVIALQSIHPTSSKWCAAVKNEAETEAIANALEKTAWNRKRAAMLLNISYKALLYKITAVRHSPPPDRLTVPSTTVQQPAPAAVRPPPPFAVSPAF